MRFSKKTAHRIIVSLAMVAPVMYLFGALFFTLNGAHGNSGLSAEYEIPVSTKNVDFQQLISNGDFSQGTQSWTVASGTSITASDGVCFVRQQSTSTLSGLSRVLAFNLGHIYYSSCYVLNVGSYSFNCFIGQSYSYGPAVSCSVGVSTLVNARWQCVDNVGNYSYFCIGNRSASNTLYEYEVTNVCLFDLTSMYGAGNEPSIEDFREDFPLPYYEYSASVETITLFEYGTPDYSQYLFNQFFPKDNFLERMGLNALSANPIGFAPFGTFLSYLDVNVFHASGSQVALMLYGMVYWSLHVIIADLVYHVAVFIPNIIQRVFDWFGQKGLEDD